MLKRNGVKPRLIKDISRSYVIFDNLIPNLETDGRGIVIGAAVIGHRDDIGLKVGLRYRERTMQVVGECRNSATARKIVSDKRYLGARCKLIFHSDLSN